ncbi:uncharacterized protein LOC108101322 isoform X1 [Drosophila ficusphila]|uniref:uncharacterized protein LOC108101322 isoform X1 n=1 Tax=Drosophila ficusphila TaxID=30025 RepID=UPI0007E8AAC5|nr:uncharacterized protein LOC108101322 isoform X1 [Drosophila ficusphila]
MPQSRALAILPLMIIMIHVILAANFNYEILADDEHPNKCVLKGPAGDEIVESGNSVRHPTKCAQIECGRNGWALVYNCEEEHPPKGCEHDGYVNIKAEFPECCDMKLKCNNV